VKQLIQQIMDIITATRPAVESLWVGIALAAVMGGLSYLADNTGTFTIQAVLGGALGGVLNYVTSKSRREETKTVKADADKRVEAVLFPQQGETDY